MKKSHLLIFLLCLVITFPAAGQLVIPKGYFSSPLGIGLSITGAFGEIRPNHFHSGIDFQVEKKEGLPVYAIADGYVSRIKISPVGFGNALYIDHPNGFTSVYGHLYDYSDTFRAYAHKEQYSRRSFEVDLFPANKKDTLWVKRGQLIGYAGNSGSSFGAHLHFELRDTHTERIINPLHFGFDCADSYSPFVDFIMVYPVDKQSFVSYANETRKLRPEKKDDGEYQLAKGDTLVVWGKVAFGVQAFDYLSNGYDRNGWYSIKMYIDKAPFFEMKLDSFAFSETRFINAALDYEDGYDNGSRIITSRKKPGNELSVFHALKNEGVVTFSDNQLHEVVLVISDLAGHDAVVRFPVKSSKPVQLIESAEIVDADTAVFFTWNADNQFSTDEIKVNVPAGSLYESDWFTYKKLPKRRNTFSELHQLNKPEVPLQKKIRISINASRLPAKYRSKAMLARIDREGEYYSAGGSYSQNFVTAESNQFDTYAIVVDSIPPSIRLIKEPVKHRKSLKFKVSDNFSGIDDYKGELNGEWVLVEWDPKNKLMQYRFDEMLRKGKNSFKLTLVDQKGNKSSFRTSINKK